MEKAFSIQRSAAKETGLTVFVGIIMLMASEGFALSMDELLAIFIESYPQPIDCAQPNDLPLSIRWSLGSEPALGTD